MEEKTVFSKLSNHFAQKNLYYKEVRTEKLMSLKFEMALLKVLISSLVLHYFTARFPVHELAKVPQNSSICFIRCSSNNCKSLKNSAVVTKRKPWKVIFAIDVVPNNSDNQYKQKNMLNWHFFCYKLQYGCGYTLLFRVVVRCLIRGRGTVVGYVKNLMRSLIWVK